MHPPVACLAQSDRILFVKSKINIPGPRFNVMDMQRFRTVFWR